MIRINLNISEHLGDLVYKYNGVKFFIPGSEESYTIKDRSLAPVSTYDMSIYSSSGLELATYSVKNIHKFFIKRQWIKYF